MSSNLIRLGGLVAMVCAIAWVVGQAVSIRGVLKVFLSHRLPFLPFSQALEILSGILLTLGAMAAVAALHALQSRHYGLPGALSFLVAFVGLASHRLEIGQCPFISWSYLVAVE